MPASPKEMRAAYIAIMMSQNIGPESYKEFQKLYKLSGYAIDEGKQAQEDELDCTKYAPYLEQAYTSFKEAVQNEEKTEEIRKKANALFDVFRALKITSPRIFDRLES